MDIVKEYQVDLINNTWTRRITIDRREVATAMEGNMADWNISYTIITMKNNFMPININEHYPTFREEWKAIVNTK